MKKLFKHFFMKRIVSMILAMIMCLGMLSGCAGNKGYDPLEGVETTFYKDSCGRNVEIPADITRIAGSGSVSQMILMTIAPDLMVGLASSPTTDRMPYFPEEMWYLPTFGQFYGSKSNLNMEALLEAQPRIIIDLGDKKTGHAADMNAVQKQTGIPTVFIEATVETMPEAYRSLGQLLGREEEAEKLAQFVEKTLAMAEEKSAQIAESDRKTVYYGTGSAGLACNAAGSTQAQVIELIGADNAIVVSADEVTNKGGGTIVSLEELYMVDPDVIVLAAGGPYSELGSNEWSELTAVVNGEYYEIPNLPYCWMGAPPSVNMVLGIWWLGQLVYPEIYDDYDMVEIAREYYSLFWHYELTADEAREMLADSILK